MKIRITQADIDAGVRGDCENCPLAVALGRHYPEGAWQVVCNLSMGIVAHHYVGQGGGHKSYVADAVGQWFVRHFDAGNSVEPVALTLKQIDV